MQALVNAVTQSVMTRFLANIFLFLLVTSALTIATYQIMIGAAVNPIILSLLSIGAGNALAILGINHGSTLTPLSPADLTNIAAQQAQQMQQPTVTTTTMTSSHSI